MHNNARNHLGVVQALKIEFLRQGRIWFGLVFALLGLSQCASQPTSPNVVFILVDTLRADHLSCYGYSRQTSPNLDRFAADNLLFLNNYSQASCTFPSVNSMLTSQYAFEFYGKAMGIPDEMPYLPAILDAHGYRTMAISASPIMRDKPSRFNPDGGFGRGFDEFVERMAWAPASRVHRVTMDSLRWVRKPFFAYLHYMDPHGPYQPPHDFERRFAKDYQGPEFIVQGKPNPIEAMLYNDGPKVEFTERDIQHLVDLYDDEIAYFDEWFGRLIEKLSSRSWWDNTLVVIAADHGEEFLEHGHIKHCRCLYDTQTHTPLIIKLPGQSAKGTRKALTQNLDLVPTILDVLGIPYDGLGFKGQSLRPLFQTDAPINPVAFSAQGSLRSVNDLESKLIVDLSKDQQEFYDLVKDPGEMENLVDRQPQKLQDLATILTEWLHRNQAAGDLEKSQASQELLRSLGYIQ